MTRTPPGSRLPALGRRGGGWVAGQVVLIAAVFASALLGGGPGGGLATAAHVVGAALLVIGSGLLGTAALQRGTRLTPFPAPRPGQDLTTTGAFALSRHPMYGGGILIALGWSTVFASAAGVGVSVLLAIFLDLKARREEAWLAECVPGYDEYRHRTRRRLLPFLY